MLTVEEAARSGVDAHNASFFNEAGHVASGSGHQFNNANFWGYDPERLLRREVPKRELSESSLQWLADRFIKPGNFERARSLLGRSRLVLVSGSAGAGRRSAAKMLLRELADGGGPVREIPTDTSEEEKDFLNPETVRDCERLLLDLSADTEFRLLTFALRPLESFRDAVTKAEGYLAVVLPSGAERLLPPELLAQLVELERPPGRSTLELQLEVEGVGVPVGSLDGEELAEFLADASMDEIGRLCQRSLRLHERDGRRLEDCLTQALQEVSKRDAAIEDLIAGETASQRALILGAAFLEGAHADVVGDACERLLAQADGTEETEALLDGSGLNERMRDVGLELTEAREVLFSQHSADAVVNYFWYAFPRLRPTLLEWVGGCLISPLLTDADRERAVRRFAMVCRRSRHGPDLCALAAWLLRLETKHRPVRVGEWAARILAEGLKEEPGAHAIRRKIYEWVVSPSLQSDLASVLVLVCSGVLAHTHPEQAMVRLRHLARHSDDEVSRAAGKALVELANDDRVLLDLLWRFASSRMDADAALFLRVVDSGRLLEGARVLDDSVVQAQLTKAWASVVERPREFWSERAYDWFDAFTADPSAEVLLEVLVGAVASAGRLGRLFVVLRNWARDGAEESAEERRRTALVVRKKIDEAQLKRVDEEKAVAR